MKLRGNDAISKLSRQLDCDYPFALGFFLLMKEIDKNDDLDSLSADRLIYDLGYISRETSHKFSRKKREELCEIYRETLREIKREEDRERQREYYERKRRGSSSPLPPIPPIPPISPQEKERESINIIRTTKQFKKPTADEIKAYCEEIDYKLDAERFIDYYEANGWMAGTRKMKDWKATIRNWKRRAEERGENTSAKHTGTAEIQLTAEEEAAIERIYAANGRDAFM